MAGRGVSKEQMAKLRAAQAEKRAQRKIQEAARAARPGDAVRVLLPKARDPMQRTVAALVSEVDPEPGSVLVWCIPGRASSGFTVQVNHRKQVTDQKLGWWEWVE